MTMFHLLAALACTPDEVPDSDPPPVDDTGQPLTDEHPIVFIEGETLVFAQDQSVQVSGTATDRQTPDELTVEWWSDVDGLLATSTAKNGLVSLRAPEMSLGWHTLTLKAIDPDGLEATTSAQLKRNQRPLEPEFQVLPAEPTDSEALSVELLSEGVDPDGDALTPGYRWYRDGELSAYQTATVPASALSGGEIWEVEVFFEDGIEEGEVGVAKVQIENHLPGTPGVAMSPERIAAGVEPAVCEVTKPATDVDGQELSYWTVWVGDGLSYPDDFKDALGATDTVWPGDTLPAADTDLAETWTCSMQADDGWDLGPAGSAFGTAVEPTALGMTTLQKGQKVEAGRVMMVPVTVYKDATLVALVLYTSSANGELKMALYSDTNDGPRELLTTTDTVTLVEGENILLTQDQLELEPGETYWVAFTHSDTETLHYRSDSKQKSVYYPLKYGKPWPSSFTSSGLYELDGYRFNTWMLVK